MRTVGLIFTSTERRNRVHNATELTGAEGVLVEGTVMQQED